MRSRGLALLRAVCQQKGNGMGGGGRKKYKKISLNGSNVADIPCWSRVEARGASSTRLDVTRRRQRRPRFATCQVTGSRGGVRARVCVRERACVDKLTGIHRSVAADQRQRFRPIPTGRPGCVCVDAIPRGQCFGRV